MGTKKIRGRSPLRRGLKVCSTSRIAADHSFVKNPQPPSFSSPSILGQRSEPESQGGLGAGAFGGWPGMIFGDGGSHLSFGIGAFPFAFFASAFNLNDGRPPPPEVGTQQYREETFLNRVFIVVSVLFAIWLVLL